MHVQLFLVFLSCMDDIQNIIYFAVLIIWFLSRAFGGNKKKKQRQQQQQYPTPPLNESGPLPEYRDQPKPEPVTFEDILRELSGAPPKTAPPPPAPFEEEESSFEEVFGQSYEDTQHKTTEPKAEEAVGHPDFVLEGGFKEFVIKKDRGTKIARDVRRILRKPDGLKQAIVLKEILDRKY